ncbi:MAG: acylphosphatase [Candidatus Cloacimonetes bacterium]|jgi:acylphosphatase|nr:acylphosphatase [Candidatus Cloacimonadota bacterium]MDD4157181.1 acylphosphatase [Candidatus Cloacimonadota bacterium]
MQTLKLLVEGRVQGVGFRHYIFKYAKRLELKGYVKNLDDGKVEIVVNGEESKISDMIKVSRKGPTFSWVYNIQVYDIDESNKEIYDDFKIIY